MLRRVSLALPGFDLQRSKVSKQANKTRLKDLSADGRFFRRSCHNFFAKTFPTMAVTQCARPMSYGADGVGEDRFERWHPGRDSRRDRAR